MVPVVLCVGPELSSSNCVPVGGALFLCDVKAADMSVNKLRYAFIRIMGRHEHLFGLYIKTRIVKYTTFIAGFARIVSKSMNLSDSVMLTRTVFTYCRLYCVRH